MQTAFEMVSRVTVRISCPSLTVLLGTFSIPIKTAPGPDDPNVFHIPTNDHDGKVSAINVKLSELIVVRPGHAARRHPGLG